jgi:hypothetical protein
MDWVVSLLTLKLSTLCDPEGAIEADMGVKEKAAKDRAAKNEKRVKAKKRFDFINPPVYLLYISSIL